MLQWLLYASWKKHDIPICNSVFPKTLLKTTQVKAACALLPGNILLRGLTMAVVICIAYPMYLLLLSCLGDFNEKNNKSLWMSKSNAGVALTWSVGQLLSTGSPGLLQFYGDVTLWPKGHHILLDIYFLMLKEECYKQKLGCSDDGTLTSWLNVFQWTI